MARNSQKARFFICNPLTNTYFSLVYETLFNALSDTQFQFLSGVWAEIQASDITGIFRKSIFEFLKCLAGTLNNATLKPRKGSVHKIGRQKI